MKFAWYLNSTDKHLARYEEKKHSLSTLQKKTCRLNTDSTSDLAVKYYISASPHKSCRFNTDSTSDLAVKYYYISTSPHKRCRFNTDSISDLTVKYYYISTSPHKRCAITRTNNNPTILQPKFWWNCSTLITVLLCFTPYIFYYL